MSSLFGVELNAASDAVTAALAIDIISGWEGHNSCQRQRHIALLMVGPVVTIMSCPLRLWYEVCVGSSGDQCDYMILNPSASDPGMCLRITLI